MLVVGSNVLLRDCQSRDMDSKVAGETMVEKQDKAEIISATFLSSYGVTVLLIKQAQSDQTPHVCFTHGVFGGLD